MDSNKRLCNVETETLNPNKQELSHVSDKAAFHTAVAHCKQSNLLKKKKKKKLLFVIFMPCL